MSIAGPAAAFRLTGRHVLAGVVIFFLIVVSVDTLFAFLAYRTFSGQSANSPYEAGLLYNRTLAQRRAEDGLGWNAVLAMDGPRLSLRLTDAAGAPLDGLQVRGGLTRPATEAGRRNVTLHAQGGGLYIADIGRLTGAWDVSAEVSQAGEHRLRVERRIEVR